MRRAIAARLRRRARRPRGRHPRRPLRPTNPAPGRSSGSGRARRTRRFARLAAEADYTVLIAPETGGILAERARTIERVGGRSLGSTPAAIELTGDKLRLGRHLAERGIATPAVPPRDPAPRASRRLSLSRRAQADRRGRLAGHLPDSRTPTPVPTAARAMPRRLLQPFVPGVADERELPGRARRAGPADRGGPAARRDPRRPVRLPRRDASRARRAASTTARAGRSSRSRAFAGSSGSISSGTRRPGVRPSSRSTRGRRRPTSASRAACPRDAGPRLARRGRRDRAMPDGSTADFPRRSTRKTRDLRGRRWDDGGPTRESPHERTCTNPGWRSTSAAPTSRPRTPSGQARTLPFELWKRPDELGQVLAALAATFPPCDRVALTMTAELCDCYPTKAVGVNAVLDAVLDAFPGRPIAVWGIDGRFHDVDEIRAAAARWRRRPTGWRWRPWPRGWSPTGRGS